MVKFSVHLCDDSVSIFFSSVEKVLMWLAPVLEVPPFSTVLANAEVNNTLEESVGDRKRGCYVKLLPDLKAQFYNSMI